MVAQYNARASNQGLAPDEMQAYRGDLLNEKDPNPTALADPQRFFNFDVAACGLGFHHFDNPTFAARQIVGRLKPGGVFVLLDFLPHSKMEVGFFHLLPFFFPLSWYKMEILERKGKKN